MPHDIKLEAIATLEKLANLNMIADSNPFKIRAYINGAKALQEFEGNLVEAINSGDIKKIPGIGKGILAIIDRIAKQEPVLEMNEICAVIPVTILELLKIDGLGPKRTRLLWLELGIKNLGELEYALKENRLGKIKGFSQKLCQSIENSVSAYRKTLGHFRLDQLLNTFIDFKKFLGEPVDLAGQVSLAAESAEYLEIAWLSHKTFLESLDYITNKLDSEDTVTKAHNQNIIINFKDVPIKIFVCTQSEIYGTFLLFHRCELSFWQKLVQKAQSKSLSLEKDGLRKNNILIKTLNEDDVFDAIAIYPVASESRSLPTILVDQGKPIKRLIVFKDLRGAFHNHTVASDGKNTLEQMREKAISLGLSYLGISDHSQTAFYANGLKENEIFNQLEQILSLNNDKLGKICHLFSGTESDILAHGELDFPAEILQKLDIVIASVHSRLKQDYQQMTERMINAAKNPFTTIIGHPTGRLILDRPKSAFDMRALIDTAKLYGTVLELNANPHRLDLDFHDLCLAKEASVMIAINADAHSTQGLNDLEYGIMIARKAGLNPENVLNCLNLKDVKSWLKNKREKFLNHDL